MKIATLIRKIAKRAKCLAALLCPNNDDIDYYPPEWFSNDWKATLIDRSSGRVLAHVWDDGCGKYYPTLFVSFGKAYQLMRVHACYVSWFDSFPWVTLDLLRLKSSSLSSAQHAIEHILGE
jgi:hypothetical protein